MERGVGHETHARTIGGELEGHKAVLPADFLYEALLCVGQLLQLTVEG